MVRQACTNNCLHGSTHLNGRKPLLLVEIFVSEHCFHGSRNSCFLWSMRRLRDRLFWPCKASRMDTSSVTAGCSLFADAPFPLRCRVCHFVSDFWGNSLPCYINEQENSLYVYSGHASIFLNQRNTSQNHCDNCNGSSNGSNSTRTCGRRVAAGRLCVCSAIRIELEFSLHAGALRLLWGTQRSAYQ